MDAFPKACPRHAAPAVRRPGRVRAAQCDRQSGSALPAALRAMRRARPRLRRSARRTVHGIYITCDIFGNRVEARNGAGGGPSWTGLQEPVFDALVGLAGAAAGLLKAHARTAAV